MLRELRKQRLFAGECALYLLFATCIWGCQPEVKLHPDLADPLGRLIRLNRVETLDVGGPDEEGAFRTLQDVFLAKGTADDFRQMARHPNPVVRAMGMICLASTEREAAVPLLREHLGGLEHFETVVVDMGGSFSEGQLAGALLYEGGFWCIGLKPKDANEPYGPLVPESERLSLAIAVNARDELSPASPWITRWFLDAEKRKEFPLVLDWLRERCPGLSDCEIIKAIGRMAPINVPDLPELQEQSKRFHEFLMFAVANEELGVSARLAAGSALVWWSDDETGTELTRDTESLDRLTAPHRYGSRLVSDWLRRRAAEDAWKTGDKIASACYFTPNRDSSVRVPWAIAKTSLCQSPVVFDLLCRAYLDVPDPNTLALPFARALDKIIALAPGYRQPWSACSDIPWSIDDFLRRSAGGVLERALGRTEYGRLLKRLRDLMRSS